MAISRKVSSDMTTILVLDCEGQEVDTIRRVMKPSSTWAKTVAYKKHRYDVLSRMAHFNRVEYYFVLDM